MIRKSLLLASLLASGVVVLVGSPERARSSPEEQDSAKVKKISDIAYREDKDADPVRHKLDLYLPTETKTFPVLLFVHGGSWQSGNKNLYSLLGQVFARSGIGMVLINYRLSPQFKHPIHEEDVARAFAWTKANIGTYGGDPERIFLMGHSAGGHLVSLLATDPKYLRMEKLEIGNIRGVISVSGVYEINPEISVFHPAFGKDAKICRDASPLEHVTGKHPPFLIAYADKDFEYLDQMAINMDRALVKAKSSSKLIKLDERNHISIIIKVADPLDPLNKAVREFVQAKVQ